MILHMMVYFMSTFWKVHNPTVRLGLDRSCRNLVVFDRINFSKIYLESAQDSAHDGMFCVYILKSPQPYLGLGLDCSCRNLVVFDRINFSKIYLESAQNSAHDGMFCVYILKSPQPYC